MSTRATTILVFGIAGLAILGALLGRPDGHEANAAPTAVQVAANESPAPPDVEAPDWVLDEAQRQSRVFDDPHPDAAHWGLVPLGSLEALMENEWPDPTMTTYVIVLVGDFSMATTSHPFSPEMPERLPDRAAVAVFLYSTQDRSLSSFSLLRFGDAVTALPEELHGFSL